MHSLMNILQAPTGPNGVQFSGYLTKTPCGPYLDVARNFVVQSFMNQTTADVLLFIDSDIEFTREAAFKVVDRAAEMDQVVGGWYSSNFLDAGVRPVAFEWDAENILTPIKNPKPKHHHKVKSVDVVGTGFMAIPRSILTDLRKIHDLPSPWFAEEVMFGSAMGEDVTFCQRVIHNLKRKVYVDFSVQVNHIKPIKLTTTTTIK
jgi:hypothetical protein